MQLHCPRGYVGRDLFRDLHHVPTSTHAHLPPPCSSLLARGLPSDLEEESPVGSEAERFHRDDLVILEVNMRMQQNCFVNCAGGSKAPGFEDAVDPRAGLGSRVGLHRSAWLRVSLPKRSGTCGAADGRRRAGASIRRIYSGYCARRAMAHAMAMHPILCRLRCHRRIATVRARGRRRAGGAPAVHRGLFPRELQPQPFPRELVAA